ncbi:hypothetical protein CL634_02340 [bacterium]|nr:hypothetical protein [bacterium]|tara:strand:- start:572 stop:829 length:258 start_codon:yes stop_codon:yes gene_type:complete
MSEYIMLSDEEMEELSCRTHNLVDILQEYQARLDKDYENEALNLSRMLMISALVSVIHRVYHNIPPEHQERLDNLLDFSGSNVIN